MTTETEEQCQQQIRRMLRNSQTRIIAPIITLGLLMRFVKMGQRKYSDSEIRACYGSALEELIEYLGHDLHVGAKYYDAYGSRMSRYGILNPVGHLRYEIHPAFANHAENLCAWIREEIKAHIESKLDIIPQLARVEIRVALSQEEGPFLQVIDKNLRVNAANFEVFSFAILRVHLEKFACRIYRDTRTSAHDHGVDFSTDFGVVYQLKRIRVLSRQDGERILRDLESDFDSDRLTDGKIVLVIDELTHDVKTFLINMRVQPLTRRDLLELAKGFTDPEDRQKVLRVVYDEFRREYGARKTK